MVAAQGGDLKSLDEHWGYMKADRVVEVKCKKKGYITEMQTEGLGRLLIYLGGGRNEVGAKINHSVGFLFHKKLGSLVKAEDTLVTVFLNKECDLTYIEQTLHDCIRIGATKKNAPKLILEANVK